MSDGIQKLEKQLAALSPEDSNTEKKVDLLNDLARELSMEHPGRAIEVATDALDLSRGLGYRRGEATARLALGFSHYMLSNHDAALAHLPTAVTLFEELGDKTLHGMAVGQLAGVQLSLGDYEQALAHSFTSLKLLREAGNKQMEGWMLHGIGGGYHDLGDHERSLQYNEEALKLFEELDFPVGIARSLNGIGTVKQALGHFDEALDYHKRSLEIFESVGNPLGEARALNDLGVVYTDLGDFDKAFDCHTRSLELRRQVGNRQAQSTSLLNLGKLYTAKEEPEKALEYLHRALTIAMEVRTKLRIWQINLAMSDAYEQTGDFENALAHYKIYQQTKEEVSGDQANSRIKNLQIGFETEKAKREAEISHLKNVELREKNEQLQKLLRELKETQAQLVQSEKIAAMGQLVAGVVHEINTPVGAIRSGLDVMTRCIVNIIDAVERTESIEELRADDQVQRSLDILQRNNKTSLQASDRITQIVQSLKSFAQLDEASFQNSDVHECIDSTLALVSADTGGRIDIVREYGELPKIPGYPAELNQLFMHLLTNAKNAIKDTGTITIRTFAENDNVYVQVSDDGVGIPEEQMAGLFEPSFRVAESRVKAGMGLFTCFKIVQKHGGWINVESKVGRGSTFTVQLPAGTASRSGTLSE